MCQDWARPPLVGCICGLAGSTSSASALRCCRCCRVARRGTVCPAPLPLGTACPIPCSSPHCTPVRVSCAPLPAKARVGPACSALPPPPSPFPFPVPSDATVVAHWLTLPLSSYPPSRHRSRSITEATSACGACTCGGAPPGVPADDVAVSEQKCRGSRRGSSKPIEANAAIRLQASPIAAEHANLIANRRRSFPCAYRPRR